VNVLKPHLRTTTETLFAHGASQREIERRTGVDRKTIRRYARSANSATLAAGTTDAHGSNSSTLATGSTDADGANSPTPATGSETREAQTPPRPWPPRPECAPLAVAAAPTTAGWDAASSRVRV
jgi:hypothetical protein